MDFLNVVQDDEEVDEINLVVHGIPRRINERFDYFHSFDNLTFFQRFRISKITALNLLDMIEADIEHPYDYNNSVAPVNQLLVFLRFCATGSHLSLIGDFAGMHRSTVSRIIKRVAAAIASLANRFIYMPREREERERHWLRFYEKARFPRVIGAVDCTHVRIQSPGGNDGEVFRNRKGFFSLNVQVVAHPNLKIANIVARWPGSTHDSTIFNNSRLKQEFENNLYPNSILLGDSGYFLRAYLLTPLLNPQNRAEYLYNEAHIRTRNVVERLFGILKRRFPILAYGSRLKLQTTLVVIVACAVLHNICIDNNDEEPPDPEDLELFLRIIQEDEIPDMPIAEAGPVRGIQTRQDLINYFATLIE